MINIISIKDLRIAFNEENEVIKKINLDVAKGKTTAVVGESGSGKTLSALSILKLLPNGAKLFKVKYFSKILIFYLYLIMKFKKLEGIKLLQFSKSP